MNDVLRKTFLSFWGTNFSNSLFPNTSWFWSAQWCQCRWMGSHGPKGPALLPSLTRHMHWCCISPENKRMMTSPVTQIKRISRILSSWMRKWKLNIECSQTIHIHPKVEILYQLFSLHFTSSMSIHFCKYHSKNSQTSTCLLMPVFCFCF